MNQPLEPLREIWVYLATTPLLGLTVTLIAYQGGLWIYEKLNRNPLANPVLIAVIALVALLLATDTDYGTYVEGAQFVHFLLGPATVGLAVPLYNQFRKVRSAALPLGVALLAGTLTAAASAVGIAWLLGAGEQTLLSLAPKSATTPVARPLSYL